MAVATCAGRAAARAARSMRARCVGGGSASAGAQHAGGRAGALLQAEEQLRGGAGRAASNAPRAQMPRCHAQGVGGAPRALQKPGRGVREGRRRARAPECTFSAACAPPRRPRPHGWAVRKGTQTPPTSPAAQLCRRAAVSAARCQAAGARACARAHEATPGDPEVLGPSTQPRVGEKRRRAAPHVQRHGPPARRAPSLSARQKTLLSPQGLHARGCVRARRRGEAPCTHWQPLRCR